MRGIDERWVVREAREDRLALKASLWHQCRLSRHPANHGIGLILKRSHTIQPVQIGMTDTQPSFQHVQAGAIIEPFHNDAKGPGGLISAGIHDARCFFKCIKIKPLAPSDKRRAALEN